MGNSVVRLAGDQELAIAQADAARVYRDLSVYQREEAPGTSAVCKPLLPSIIVIGSRPIIVTTLTGWRAC